MLGPGLEAPGRGQEEPGRQSQHVRTGLCERVHKRASGAECSCPRAGSPCHIWRGRGAGSRWAGWHTGSPASARGTSLPRKAPSPAELAGGADFWGVVGGTQDPGPSRLDRRPGAASGVPKLAPGGRRSQWGRGLKLGTRATHVALVRGQLLDRSLPCPKATQGLQTPPKWGHPPVPSPSAIVHWLGLWGAYQAGGVQRSPCSF